MLKRDSNIENYPLRSHTSKALGSGVYGLIRAEGSGLGCL